MLILKKYLVTLLRMILMHKLKTENGQRIDTGPIQIDDDWPGIFIRGDHALGHAVNTKMLAEDLEDGPLKRYLMSLHDLLICCNATLEKSNI